MSTRECTDVGEDCIGKESVNGSFPEDESWPGAAGGWAGQTGCKRGAGVSAGRTWGGGTGRKGGRRSEGDPRRDWGRELSGRPGGGQEAGRRRSPRRKWVRPAAGLGLWGLVQEAPGKPRGGGPSPGSAPRGGRRAFVTQGRAAGPRWGRGPLRPPSGAPRVFPEPGACRASSRQARAADPWVRACLEGTHRVALSEPRSTPQPGWMAAPAPPRAARVRQPFSFSTYRLFIRLRGTSHSALFSLKKS